MKKRLGLMGLVAFAGLASIAHAEDSISIFGHYWKERSTRVIAPMMRVTKDLPDGWQVDATYLVDQITSASGAFTATDEPFSEYRNEVRLAVAKELFDVFTPSINARYSTESDYTSIGIGADLSLSLFQDNTLFRFYASHYFDEIRQRERPGFEDQLDTTLLGVSASQVLSKNLVGGGAFEMQFLTGFSENPYRVENHPRTRNRYSISGWLRYLFEPTYTTGRATYRVYFDNWSLLAHSVDLELNQPLSRHFVLAPRFRIHTQDGVFFTELTDGFVTADPKLMRFASRLYQLSLRWNMLVLEDTFLEIFAPATAQLSYGYLDQDNAYGPAHIAQVGWFWPF